MISLLYVDDESALLEIGKRYLEREGEFSIDTATSASAALSLMESKDYDAVISDYMMPETDGIRLLKQIRASGDTVPFILFTGQGSEDIVIRALEEGADFYFRQGNNPKEQFVELARKIRQVVSLHRAERQRTEAEKRLRDIINFLPDATFVIDSDGNVIAWNQAMEKMTGVPAHAMLGKGNYAYAVPFYGERRPILIDLVLEPDEMIEQNRYLSIVRENTMLTAESVVKKTDGTLIRLWEKACPLFDKNGNPTGLIESIRDITALRQAEDALRESEEKYRELVENASSIILRWDTTGKITFLNEFGLRFFGFTNDEIIGKSVMGTIVPATESGSERDLSLMIDDIIRNPEKYELNENENITRNGKRVWIRWQNKTLLDKNGQVAGLFSIGTDITERKRAEDLSRTTVQRLDTLISNLYAGVMMVSDDGKVEHVNQAMCDLYQLPDSPASLYGLPADEMIKKIRDAYASPDESLAHIQELTTHGIPLKGSEVALSNGRIVMVDFIPIIDPDGRKGGRIWHHQDITERKQAEEQLKRFNEDLEIKVAERTKALNKSLHEKEILLAEIHHRVKNNLQIIISLFRLQKKQIADTTLLDQIADSENRVRSMALVHEKLYRSGDFSSINLDDYFRTLATQLALSSTASREHVSIVTDAKGISIQIDQAIPLGLIMNELISNSLKYAFPEQRTGQISVCGRDQGTSLVFTISDNGIGMQSGIDWKNTTTMGLHIVAMLTEQLNGTIELERGEGTRYCLTIPKVQETK